MLRGMCEGIAYFKTHRAESIKIIKEKYKAEGELDDETATHLYDDLKNDLAGRNPMRRFRRSAMSTKSP